MNETQVLEVVRLALLTTLKMGLPVMLIALGVGLTIALFQALTQIQEVTLTFVPKIIAIFCGAHCPAPFMLSTLITFTNEIFDLIVAMG